MLVSSSDKTREAKLLVLVSKADISCSLSFDFKLSCSLSFDFKLVILSCSLSFDSDLIILSWVIFVISRSVLLSCLDFSLIIIFGSISSFLFNFFGFSS